MSRRLVLWALSWYQAWSNLHPPRCRFRPTCSRYCVEAVEQHGAGPGLWLAARRLGRCNPFGRHGYDPVPPPRSQRLLKERHV